MANAWFQKTKPNNQIFILHSHIMDDDKFIEAKRYDGMINWTVRLARETPLMEKYMHPGTLLDLACASGRHSLDLEDKGWTCYGVDYSEEMIAIANELKQEKGSPSTFLTIDIASPDFVSKMRKMGVPKQFDNAILVGNAIANLGSRQAASQFVTNLFSMLRPGGRLISQTVYRPQKPFYMPLRQTDGMVIQRIMIPVLREQHNVDLHVNRIDLKNGEYAGQKADNHFYMFTREEYQRLFENAGFEIKYVFGGYDESDPIDEDGATLVWVIDKPQISLTEEGLEFLNAYAGMDRDKILQNLNDIWQDSYMIDQYHCIRDARYLHPRIISHPKYAELSENLMGKRILDIGCNIGTDIRKLIVDGAQPELTVGIDLDAEYFDLGYRFYEDKDRLQTKFMVADLTKGDDELEASFDMVHAGSLLHLLDEEQANRLIEVVFANLNPSGVFFGRTLGREEPLTYHEGLLKHLDSPETLKHRLEKTGFTQVEITSMPDEGNSTGEHSTPLFLTMMFVAYKP